MEEKENKRLAAAAKHDRLANLFTIDDHNTTNSCSTQQQPPCPQAGGRDISTSSFCFNIGVAIDNGTRANEDATIADGDGAVEDIGGSSTGGFRFNFM